MHMLQYVLICSHTCACICVCICIYVDEVSVEMNVIILYGAHLKKYE